MQIKLLSSAVLSAAFIFAQTSFAALPPKPAACPAVNAIQSVGIEAVEQAGDGSWLAGVEANEYGTGNAWTFAVGDIQAANAEEARSKAAVSLQSLQFKQGPLPVPEINVWACLFQTGQGYRAVSVTPPVRSLKTGWHAKK